MQNDRQFRNLDENDLWVAAWKHFYLTEPYNVAGEELRVRQLHWRTLQSLLRELQLRGVQLSLDPLIGE